MKVENDTIIFSTGRKARANLGIIGIGPGMEISGGYDAGLSEDKWLVRERAELADYMIQQWTQYRATLGRRRR